MNSSFADAIRPHAGKSGRAVVEHEVLRIAANIGGGEAHDAAENARREVLAWAQKRSGSRLPDQAWAMDGFEHMAGGRNCSGVRIKTDAVDIWAIRADDPDKAVAGRIWTHEVVVGLMADQRPRFSVRQLVSTAEAELLVEPHTPGFVQQVVDACGLRKSTYEVDLNAWIVRSDSDAADLVEELCDPSRTDPVLVLSVPEDSTDLAKPLVDEASLSRATLGIARVAVLPARFSWTLTDAFGKARAVFNGAARAYLPGFSPEANPYDHRLMLAAQLASPEGQARAARWMRSIAAAESLKRARLGREVLAFAPLRNAALHARREQLNDEGAAESERLAVVQDQVKALEADVADAVAMQEYFSDEAQKEKERAEAAETQLRASAYRIQQLQDLLDAGGEVAQPVVELPQRWAEFVGWCDANFAGRLALAPAARRGTRQPEFDDVALAARSLVWLATTYRDGRRNGADGDFRDHYFEEGIRNSPCGGDEFDFDWQGRRHTADWHIKNGGNTRDPKRALRIYYCWDPETEQVVVADMPAHRTSAVS